MVKTEAKLLLNGSEKDPQRKGNVAKKKSSLRSLSSGPPMDACGKDLDHSLVLELGLGGMQSLEPQLKYGWKQYPEIYTEIYPEIYTESCIPQISLYTPSSESFTHPGSSNNFLNFFPLLDLFLLILSVSWAARVLSGNC